MISAEEQDRIALAIREVEAETDGEIVLVVASRADTYHLFPILWALLAALVLPWPLIWLTQLGTATIVLIQGFGALALTLLLSAPFLRGKLVPAAVMRARAHEAAAHEFVDHGLTRTRHRSGVLIYVARAERYAEILVDTGIAERVGQEAWSGIVASLVDTIKAGDPAAGLMTAVRDVGAILAIHAPARFDDTDELPNKVIIL
ncbi:TPM domain-containing protein [Microvirga antarctica]|uniref:TPM domain-containing protein n=1 Tax=Microvirga antarctica TaxID=2819233 RepID=UPI001B30C964|nr:TPM domain-containing protein [Microvirga antarctica]